MKAKWLIEKDFLPFGVKLHEALLKQGIKSNLFENEFDHDFTDRYEPNDCVVLYGSLQAIWKARRKTGWTPGDYCTTKNYDCVKYYPVFAKYLLNHQYAMLPFGDLKRFKDQLYKMFSTDWVFIRPCSGAKIFTGKAVSEFSWNQDIERFGFHDVDSDELVLAAPGVVILKEWRTLVVDSKVVTASQYMQIGSSCESPDVPDEVLVYAQEVVDDVYYRPDNAWTLDICETDKGYHVLEIGSFSCADLYACDPDIVAAKVSEMALEDWKYV